MSLSEMFVLTRVVTLGWDIEEVVNDATPSVFRVSLHLLRVKVEVSHALFGDGHEFEFHVL